MKGKFSLACRKYSLYCLGVSTASMLIYTAVKSPFAILQAAKTAASALGVILTGFVIAYILNPAVAFFKRRLKRFVKSEKTAVKLSVTVTYILLVTAISLFLWQIVPVLAVNIAGFLSGIDVYSERIKGISSGALEKFPFLNGLFEPSGADTATEKISALINSGIRNLLSTLFRLTGRIYNFIGAVFVSVYMLLNKENLTSQLKKALAALLPKGVFERMLRAAFVVNGSFGKYMSGVFLSALVIGALCWVCMAVFRLEYAALISAIVMMTDVIPFFGPFIGASLGCLLLLPVNAWHAVYFLIIVVVLQQLTSNIINPGIIGKATGLDTLYVLMAIIVAGDLFGIFGMLVGVPIFSIILNAVRSFVHLKEKEDDHEKSIQQ